MIKINIIVLILYISALQSIASQNVQSQAEAAWIELDSLKSYFCDYPKECTEYENGTFLGRKRFEDKVFKNKARLALNFLESYPDNPRYYEVLKLFLHMNFEPHFVPEKISDSITELLSKNSENDRGFFLYQMRALPIDISAKNQWLEKGYELGVKFLKYDPPLEQKAEIEILLLGRDLRIALSLYEYLNLQKKTIEANYWKRFDPHYWQPLRLRVQNLLYQYPDLESTTILVQQFIGIVTLKHLSPTIAEPYWRDFLKATDSTSPLANRTGIKAVHQMAKENLAAITALKVVNTTKPLEMVFTAMDDTKIDLAMMRGKVVLIDFWSIRCAPCIKEMPHVQAMYDKYRKQGFEVIGIAAEGDASKEAVLKIIKKQNATWRQRLDKGKDATVSYHSLYNINVLPTVWLLDKEGKIVDRNARGKRLEPLIRKYLGLNK